MSNLAVADLLASMLSDRPADRLPVATPGERVDIEPILAPLTIRLASRTQPACRQVLTSFGTALLRTWEPRGASTAEVSAPTSDHDPLCTVHNWDLGPNGFSCDTCGVVAPICSACGATMWTSHPCACTHSVAA